MILIVFQLFVYVMGIKAQCGHAEPMYPKYYYEEKTLEKLVRLEYRLELQETAIKTLDEKLNNQQLKASGWKNMSETLNVDQESMPVVFLANGVAKKTICEGEVARYTNILMNLGDGYDVDTGYFTAPVSGVYKFNVQLCTSTSQYANLNILANETVIASTSHRGTNQQHGTCVTFGGIGALFVGEKAAVQGSWTCYEAFTENKYRWNTFSGFLIKKTD